MALHTTTTMTLHNEIYAGYKNRLDLLESKEDDVDNINDSFERSFLHNAIYLHRLWFEQVASEAPDHKDSPLLNEILDNRGSNITKFKKWMDGFASDAMPNGWAIWGWAHSLKTFVGFPIKSHDISVPLGVFPLIVIDCWEHSWVADYSLEFDSYLNTFWNNLNWQVIEHRHQDLAKLFGYGIK